MNDLFGAEIDDRDQLHFAQNLADRVSRDTEIVEQARAHTEDEMMHGRYPKALEQILLDAMNDNEQLASKALETDENLNSLARLVLALMREPALNTESRST